MVIGDSTNKNVANINITDLQKEKVNTTLMSSLFLIENCKGLLQILPGRLTINSKHMHAILRNGDYSES